MIPFLHGAFAPNGAASAYELIESQTVGAGGSASITFTVPAGYQHLQIRWLARGSLADTFLAVMCEVNGDTASNYRAHFVRGIGSGTPDSSTNASQRISWTLANSQGANMFGAGVTDILDYGSTSKNKTFRTLSGGDANGSGWVHLFSSAWFQTSAITSLKLSIEASNIMQYSTFSLYGIKGA